jgi:hypothetical protein
MDKEKIKRIFKEVKESESEELEKMPVEVRIKLQSGYLIGYADCWNKLYNKLVKGK